LNDLTELQRKIKLICDLKNWDKDWLKGGCYIHLEVSEFIESLRGKGNDPPEKEAADVLFTLISVLSNYDYDINQVIGVLKTMTDEKLAELKQSHGSDQTGY